MYKYEKNGTLSIYNLLSKAKSHMLRSPYFISIHTNWAQIQCLYYQCDHHWKQILMCLCSMVQCKLSKKMKKTRAHYLTRHRCIDNRAKCISLAFRLNYQNVLNFWLFICISKLKTCFHFKNRSMISPFFEYPK